VVGSLFRRLHREPNPLKRRTCVGIKVVSASKTTAQSSAVTARNPNERPADSGEWGRRFVLGTPGLGGGLRAASKTIGEKKGL